jgi:hypothetical protein
MSLAVSPDGVLDTLNLAARTSIDMPATLPPSINARSLCAQTMQRFLVMTVFRAVI